MDSMIAGCILDQNCAIKGLVSPLSKLFIFVGGDYPYYSVCVYIYTYIYIYIYIYVGTIQKSSIFFIGSSCLDLMDGMDVHFPKQRNNWSSMSIGLYWF